MILDPDRIRRRATGELLGAMMMCLAAPALRAQQMEIDDLRPPASPAFILLGVAPTLVERPTSPQELAVSLLSASQGDNLLPREYALELTPFWMAPHPSLTYEDYYHPTPVRALFQSLALSFATSRLSDTTDAGTALGIGLRTLLVPGRPHPELASRERALRAIQDTMNRIRDASEREREPTLRALEDSLDALNLPDGVRDHLLDSLSTVRFAVLEAEVQDRLRRFEDAARDTALVMQGLDKERVGWQVELAGGLVFDYPGNSADSSRLGRAGIWLTVAHRLPASRLDLIGVARYRRDRRLAASRNLVDYGGRLAWEGNQFTLSGEFLEHVGDAAPSGEPPAYRVGLNLEYRLKDWGALVATLATDDARDGAGHRTVVTSLGLDLGFGSLPLLLPH